jgi:predicted ATPase/class 3 adenylate cyclase
MATHSEPSSRTYTFLFTDLEGSTRLWEQFPQAMKAALERHDAILRGAVEGSNGQVTKTTGDGLSAVFASTLDGLSACLKAQRILLDEPWASYGLETGSLRVRMGLHVGEAQPRGGDYYGPAVNRAARLMSAAHGGQVLLSAVAAGLVVDLLPEGTSLRDLGEHRLKDLARPERVFQLLHPDLAADFPPLASLDLRPNNLPAQTTALIGREVEISEVTERLGAEGLRLLTLTGPGGIGKTRLALQAAAELIDRFEDGVYFVDLAPIRDPDSVLAAIAQTVRIREASDGPLLDELTRQLRAKKMLLLLDNFEQVTAAAPQVAELLQGCPQLKLLATSREALHVRGENIYPVPPLALPRVDPRGPNIEQLTQYEAVRLFIERARAVKPDFQVTNENAPAVAEICWRLDGLPLAIELAAARIRLFSPQGLLERLGSRLKLLRGGARDLPARQQTLRDAIDWSYELLDAGERRLFELLSVFPGGCNFETVEGVVDEFERLDEIGVELIDGLASLVEKSLIRQVDGAASATQESGEPRLLMLETIREYAAERLEGDAEFHTAAHRAHATYFADFTRSQWERLSSGGREAALAGLVSDIENVRAAWVFWVREKDLEQLNKFVDSLWLLYDARGWYHATADLTNDLLHVLSSTPSTPERIEQEIVLQTSLARALLAIKGYTAEVEKAFTRALELSQAVGEIPQLYPVLRGLSSLYTYLGESEKSAQMGEKILSLAERLDDANMRVAGHLVLGINLASFNINLGLDHLEQGIHFFDPDQHRSSRFRLGHNPGVACFTTSALLLWMRGFPDRALQRSNDGVDLARKLDHPYSFAYGLFHNGLLHLWRREPERVQERARAVLDISQEHDFQVWQAVATVLLGASLAGMGQIEEGLEQVRQGIDLYQGLKTPPVFWPQLLLIHATICSFGGETEQGLALLDEVFEITGHWSGDNILPEILTLKGKLLLALDPTNAAEAELLFQRAMEISQKIHADMLELRAAISLCRLWQEQGKAEQGRGLLSGVYERFTEGFSTADLVEARELLGGGL